MCIFPCMCSSHKYEYIYSPTLVKAMVFPVVMYRCESLTIKKAEHQRIDAFELWYWRRLLRAPWTARRSKQSIEELTELRRPWCWERLKVWGEADNRGWDGWMASPTWWTWVLSKLWELVMDREAWQAAVCGVTKGQTWLSDWTEQSNSVTKQQQHMYMYIYACTSICLSIHLIKYDFGDFLVVQWLWPCTPNAGVAKVQSLVRELDPTCQN